MVINYYAVQAGLLTTLTFARHCLSPLATMEGGDNKFTKFTVPTLKAFLKVRSQNVSGN